MRQGAAKIAKPKKRAALKQEGQQQSRLLWGIVASSVLLIVGLIVATMSFCTLGEQKITDSELSASSQTSAIGVSQEPDSSSSAAADAPEQTPEAQYQTLYFYEQPRAQRYLDYAVLHPELTAEQVVVQVNVDLDTSPYEVTTAVQQPDSLLVLTSKHFYLPYDFVPDDLVQYGNAQVRSAAFNDLSRMISDASAAGLYLSPSSGFRSAAVQESLFNGYVATFGLEQASRESARPQFSEHQTGWVIDFNTANYLFYDTPEAAWLADHSWEYGFIIRYTETNGDITLYIHEPWHVRYVGFEAARYMHEHAIGSLEEYWVKFVAHQPS